MKMPIIVRSYESHDIPITSSSLDEQYLINSSDAKVFFIHQETIVSDVV